MEPDVLRPQIGKFATLNSGGDGRGMMTKSTPRNFGQLLRVTLRVVHKAQLQWPTKYPKSSRGGSASHPLPSRSSPTLYLALSVLQSAMPQRDEAMQRARVAQSPSLGRAPSKSGHFSHSHSRDLAHIC